MSQRYFLNVENSIMGLSWQGPGNEFMRQAETIAQLTDYSPALCSVLAQRGVLPHEAKWYLSPTLRDLLPNPRHLKDMERAASRLLSALSKKERIAIFADYDVDGGTSAALLLSWLQKMGHKATLYVPDRITEGYGPNAQAIKVLSESHDLIICVDCGTMSHEALAVSMCDVLVFDHHLGAETLPPTAYAIVNPNRQDEQGDLGYLCAAGVVFLLLVELNRQLREKGISLLPDLLSMLDLVALATIADVAPLVGVNRAFVQQGLKVMAKRERPAFAALADVCKLNSLPNVQSLGFAFGPRVNAGGRIGKADLGARLLASPSHHEAALLAQQLDQLNSERKRITEQVTEEALEQIEARGTNRPIVWAIGESWHPGVIGIVAARLKEATMKPAIVISLEGEEGKGSGRSVSGVDLGNIIQRLASEGLLIKGGGHAMAAGLSLKREQAEPAMARLCALVERQNEIYGDRTTHQKNVLHIDQLLMPSAVVPPLIEEIESAGPYGQSSPAPRFAFANVEIKAKKIADKHLRLSFSDGTSKPLEAIAFGAFDTALGPTLEKSHHRRFHLAGRLEMNHWQGRSRIQLKLEDAAFAEVF